MFCLLPKYVDAFKQKLKSGEIDPQKLTDMTSEERRTFFKDIVGEENAKQVNALFESKLLLKNQQAGIINWAKNVSGMKPEVLKDTLSRVQRMTNVLQPKEMDAFLADLAAQKLGVSVSMNEASHIAELAKGVAEKKVSIKPDNTFPTFESRMEYGRALVDFQDYVNGLKNDAAKLSVKEAIQPGNWGKTVKNISGIAKSLKASLDNSVIGRQGLKTLFSNPEIWYKNSKQTFVDMYKTFGGKDVMREMRAEVLSRPNAISGLYKKEGLAVGVSEEAFPTSAPEKIPGLGKAFKASESAFVGFQYRTRADVFDKYVEIAKETGADITGIGKVANALTGRGNIGALEKNASLINNVFFSPRFLKSNIDLLTVHAFDKGIGSFARKQAAMNTLKVISGVAAILTIADAVSPGSVEKDPRSSDFGKIKVGSTRFDVAGGMSSIVVLAMRMATQSSKSSVTGKITKLNSGQFGSQTSGDVLMNFAENKLSPAASVINDLFVRGTNQQGNKPTLTGELSNFALPLPGTNAYELMTTPNAANPLLGIIADALGIGVNTYNYTTNWSHNPGKELQAFQKKVGDQKFQEANDKFNTQFNDWMAKMKTNSSYQNLHEEDKQKVMTNKKDEIKQKIFQSYGFHYNSPTSKPLPKF